MRKQSKGKVQLKRGPSAIDAMVNVELTAIEDTEIDHHNPVPVSNLGGNTVFIPSQIQSKLNTVLSQSFHNRCDLQKEHTNCPT